MEKPFKFRRANEIAGAFIILVLLLLASGIIISGKVKGWFEPQRTYEVVLPDRGTLGIRKGTEVRILGSRAGSVRNVVLRHKGDRVTTVGDISPSEVKLVAIVDLRSELVAFVGSDSTAVLKHDLGGLGAPYLEITRGTVPRKDGDVTLSFNSSDQNEINLAVEDIRAAMIPAIQQFERTSMKVEQLADSLGSPESEFQQTVAGINLMLTDINEGKGPAGVFLKDEEAADQFRSSLAAFEAAMSNLSLATDGMEKVTARLPETLDLSDRAIREITETANTLEHAAEEYDVLAEGLQNHWLVRRSVNKAEAAREDDSSGNSSSSKQTSSSKKSSASSSDAAPGKERRSFSPFKAGRR